MPRAHLSIVLFLLATLTGFAQKKPIAATYGDQQWEYLVVSFGKTVFSSPEKALAYKSLGLENPNESVSLQSNLDILGRFGWEVVSIVGAIGGDQQVVLKRKYDRTRSTGEYAMIQTGRELYLKDLQDIAERARRLAEEQQRIEQELANRPQLQDLDELDRIAKREELRLRLLNAYKSKFDQNVLANGASLEIKYSSSYSTAINIDVRCDLTSQFLLDGNKYHGDAIRAHLKSLIEPLEFRHPELDKYSRIEIRIVGFMKFKGEDVRVGSAFTAQISGSSDWIGY